MKCHACGTESEFEAAFVKQRRAFGRGQRELCPTCWVKRSQFRQAWFVPLLLLGGIGGYVLERWAPQLWIGRFLVNICITGIFLVLIILPHELGHALVGRALGWRVFQVVIGVGKPLFKRRWFGILFDFRSIPLAGATWMAPTDTRWFRIKRFLSIAAGPAVNIGLAVVVVLMAQGTLSYFDFDGLPTYARLFLLANVFVVVVNLWPHQPKSGFDIPTDGKQLLQLLSFRKKALDEVQAMRFMFEAYLCRESSDFEAARAWCEKGLALYPNNSLLLNMSAVVLMDEQQYEPARKVLLTLLEKEQSAAMRFLLLNNLAYADALSGNPDLLAEADMHSKAAYAGLPWLAAVVGTRGTVLLALGKYAEGIALLKSSLEDADTVRSKAENSCHLAIGLWQSGNADEALQYLQLARQFDPKCPLLKRAQTVLGENPARS